MNNSSKCIFNNNKKKTILDFVAFLEYSASALFPTAVSYSCDWGDGSSPKTLSMIEFRNTNVYDLILYLFLQNWMIKPL